MFTLFPIWGVCVGVNRGSYDQGWHASRSPPPPPLLLLLLLLALLSLLSQVLSSRLWFYSQSWLVPEFHGAAQNRATPQEELQVRELGAAHRADSTIPPHVGNEVAADYPYVHRAGYSRYRDSGCHLVKLLRCLPVVDAGNSLLG